MKTVTDFDAYVAALTDLIWERFSEDKTMSGQMRNAVKEKITNAVIDVSVDRVVRDYFYAQANEAIAIGRLRALRHFAVPSELKEYDANAIDDRQATEL